MILQQLVSCDPFHAAVAHNHKQLLHLRNTLFTEWNGFIAIRNYSLSKHTNSKTR